MVMLPSLLVLPLAAVSLAQFVHNDPKTLNMTVIKPPGGDNVTVSYKEAKGVCKTALDSQKQYTGYVNVPGEFPTNLFFWFVEAREPTKALSIWINGGPGSSSFLGFFGGNGPCHIIDKGMDGFETAAEEWGWDRSSNMIFVDQPNQVGLSYDIPTDGTYNVINDTYTFPAAQANDTSSPWFGVNGTFSTQKQSNTANSTQIAAHAMWHLLQGFMETFPQYSPTDDSHLGVNLFAESYGGRYGPIFADYFEKQNDRRKTGEIDANSTVEIKLATLGIVNGCVDQGIQNRYYPIFANKNTYGFKAISDEELKYELDMYDSEGGCAQVSKQCQELAEKNDPEDKGQNAQVNKFCNDAAQTCWNSSYAYYSMNRSSYDLAAPIQDPRPPLHFLEYLNKREVQLAVGTPINYTTFSSNAVFDVFTKTGDLARAGNIKRLADLLKRGIRVGMMYGDRDYICNWFGGEAISLAVAAEAGGDYAKKFPAAGYSPIVVNKDYVGGEVRQFGNFSFSRIYQAGHSIYAYQPEASFQIFSRIFMGKSISTGKDIDLKTFSSDGPLNSTKTDKLPPLPKTTCWLRSFYSTCSDEQQSGFLSGKGVVINGAWYKSKEEWSDNAKPDTTSKPGPSPTLTGVFTATSTPKNAAAGFSVPNIVTLACVAIAAMVIV